MEHGDYTKAGKSLFKVLQIDNNNEKATRYMEYVKNRTGKAEVEKRKMKNAFSHREMQDDDVILPPTYKENTLAVHHQHRYRSCPGCGHGRVPHHAGEGANVKL